MSTTNDSTYRLIEETPTPPTPLEALAPRSTSPAEQRHTAVKPPERLVSLDAFRGFIMLMLAAHGFGILALSKSPPDSPLWTIIDRDSLQWIAFHFNHPPWQASFVPGTHDAAIGPQWLHFGVSFWDLIQPAFMFMVGVAMPYSFGRREVMGQSRWRRIFHAAVRSLVLILMGVFLYSLNSSSTNWIFPNVLAQIGLGYFFVSLLIGRKKWVQGLALVTILVGTWIGIHVTPAPEGVDPASLNAKVENGEIYAPPYRQWSKNLNAFHTFDVWFLNQFPRPKEAGEFRFNGGGYQTLNFVPSMATMILGLLCGELLLSDRSRRRKFWYLVAAGVICWGLGVFFGATCCPIVKRIWTPSWALFSGGYVIGMLALFYLLFDILPFRKLAFPLVVLGMNSILVYFMGELMFGWLAANVHRHFGGAIRWVGGVIADWFRLFPQPPDSTTTSGAVLVDAFLPVINATGAVLLIWLFCWWLYRQRIFLRV